MKPFLLSYVSAIHSMVRSILAKEKNSKVVLLYANKSRESTIFSQEIKDLSDRYDNFTVFDFISSQRRLDRDILAQHLQRQTNPEIYICGPTGLKKAIKAYLKDLGVSSNRLHEEDFADGYVSLFN